VAVSALAVSVIVRNVSIDDRFPGGMPAFAQSCPNQTFCSDGIISRVGFMVESDARRFANQVATASRAMTETDLASHIAVVRQGEGFAYPCDWLQLGLFDGRPAAWLAGEDRGPLYLPEGERTASMHLIPAEELRTTFDFVGLQGDGKVEVFRHKVTGELHYVARPYRPSARKWWRFWKPATGRPLGKDSAEKLYNAACSLIAPYVAHQLAEPPLAAPAQKHLKKGCEMLSRVLRSNPQIWGALWFRGVAYRGLRQLDPAYNDFRSAYALEKTNPSVGREFAGMCIALGKGPEAVQVSRELLDKYPNDAGLISNYALSLLISGNIPEAETAVEHALRIDPSDRVTQTLANFIAAVKANRRSRPDRWPPATARS
jgi:Flp pilus assembly protein TadD